jgi:glycosyltransferase involved in cell wall biosynthesis
MSEIEHDLNRASFCIVPKATGTGGMASFQLKIGHELADRGIQTTFSLKEPNLRAVLVVGGTRDLLGLLKVRQKGLPVFQRLDGMNWIHKKRRTGLRHYLKAERANLLLSWIRNRIATGVIYQSYFVKQWWDRVYGPTNVQHTVVYNGVDLESYTPHGSSDLPKNVVRILVVEGRLAGGYEIGLEHAVGFADALADVYSEPIELMIVGETAEEVRENIQALSSVPVRWAGSVSRESIPHIDRSAHILFAADIHPACPNAVIEAMACGLPVVGFETGALGELVNENAGRIIPYGSDPWNLESPNFEGLARAALDVLQNIEKYKHGARARAVKKFGLDRMVNGYLEAIGW